MPPGTCWKKTPQSTTRGCRSPDVPQNSSSTCPRQDVCFSARKRVRQRGRQILDLCCRRMHVVHVCVRHAGLLEMFLGAPRLLVRLLACGRNKSKNARWMEMLLIRFSSRRAVTKWTSHRHVGVMEESKKQVPARRTDDTTSEASSNRTSAMSTRNCIRENGTLECKPQHDDNHSWLVVGCWSARIPWLLRESAVLDRPAPLPCMISR